MRGMLPIGVFSYGTLAMACTRRSIDTRVSTCVSGPASAATASASSSSCSPSTGGAAAAAAAAASALYTNILENKSTLHTQQVQTRNTNYEPWNGGSGVCEAVLELAPPLRLVAAAAAARRQHSTRSCVQTQQKQSARASWSSCSCSCGCCCCGCCCQSPRRWGTRRTARQQQRRQQQQQSTVLQQRQRDK